MPIDRDHLARTRLLGLMSRAWTLEPPEGWYWEPDEKCARETAAVMRRLATATTRAEMVAEIENIIRGLERRKVEDGKEKAYGAWPGDQFLSGLAAKLTALQPGSYQDLPGWTHLERSEQNSWREVVNDLPNGTPNLDEPFVNRVASLLLTALADKWERVGKEYEIERDGRRRAPAEEAGP